VQRFALDPFGPEDWMHKYLRAESTLPLAEETKGPQALSDPGPALALPEYSQLFHALQSDMPSTITVCDDPNHADDLPQTWQVVIQWFD